MKNQILTPILLPAEEAHHIKEGIVRTNNGLDIGRAMLEDKRCLHLHLCSTQKPKIGDWIIDTLENTEKPFNAYMEGDKRYIKVEVATNGKMNGVPAIDGNTKALIECYYCKGKFHEQCSECNGTGKNEANFLTEFCARYNQKGVDMQRLAEEFTGYKKGTFEYNIATINFKAGYNQALQSNSRDNPIKELISELKETLEKCLPEFKTGIQHSILRASAYLENESLTKEQPKGLREKVVDAIDGFLDEVDELSKSKSGIIIECEMEIPIHAQFVGNNPSPAIKLNKDGQPILIFK